MTPIAVGIRICRLFCRIVTWSVRLVNGPPYSGEENVSEYKPVFEGAVNDSITVWVAPGVTVTPVWVATVCAEIPLPWRMRFTVMTSVSFVELLLRWSTVVTDWPFATIPIESVVETRIVESLNPMLDRLLTKPTPAASLASKNTVKFLAPRRRLELIVAEKPPVESV